jgi:putative transposase
MGRALRGVEDGGFYHVLNRGNGRMQLFHKPEDYLAFCAVLGEGLHRYPVNLLAWCLMGNHWHLVLSPPTSEALPALMHWVGVTHVRRHHAHYRSAGGGHLYQGRYKCFGVQEDRHFLAVCRYVEANPVRAKLVERAQDWTWSSLGGGDKRAPLALAEWPVEKPSRWKAIVNEPLPEQQIAQLQLSVNRGRPFGEADWTEATAKRLKIESVLRPRGRPRKVINEEKE